MPPESQNSHEQSITHKLDNSSYEKKTTIISGVTPATLCIPSLLPNRFLLQGYHNALDNHADPDSFYALLLQPGSALRRPLAI